MKKDFLKFYQDYKKKIIPTYEPKDIDKWYDDVLESKKEIKDYIPDKSIVLDIEIATQDNTVSTQCIDPYITQIFNIIPSYTQTYNLTKQDLIEPSLSKYKNISTAKHILTFAKRQKISIDKLKIIEKNLSELGQVYAKIKFKKPIKRITLTYDPIAFILLGNFPFDSGSCFGQGSRINTEKRFAFGVHPRFFLILSHKNNEDITLPDKASNIDGRAFGIFSDDYKILNFTNGKGFLGKLTVKHYYQKIYEHIYKKEKATLTDNIFRFTGGLDYVDPPTVSISTKVCTSQVCDLTKQFLNDRNKR